MDAGIEDLICQERTLCRSTVLLNCDKMSSSSGLESLYQALIGYLKLQWQHFHSQTTEEQDKLSIALEAMHNAIWHVC